MIPAVHFRLPDRSKSLQCSFVAGPRQSFRTRLGWFLAATLLFALSQGLIVAAQGQESLSPPLSQNIGDSIYSESSQNGPSSTLVEGDNSLTQPFIRSGTSDPLSFLIESGSMSPYLPAFSVVNSYANADVQSQIINDSRLGERLNEYYSNRALMGGAGGSSLPVSRSALAGNTLSGISGARATLAATSAFSGIASRAPFAAGSSALALQESGMGAIMGSGGAGGFVDPNAVVASATISASLGALQASLSGGSGVAGIPSADATTLDVGGTASVNLGSVPMSFLVPPPNNTAIGPGPGQIFPDVAAYGPSTTGFPDSTMGTAGSPYMALETEQSPLLSEHANSTDSPFASVSNEMTRYLNPTLFVAAPDPLDATQPTGPALRELARKARMHAMIYNPSEPLPSPFEQRAMERAYLRQQSGRRASRYPALTAPSIRP